MSKLRSYFNDEEHAKNPWCRFQGHPNAYDETDPRLQLRMGIEKLIFLFLYQNICYGYSKEPSQRDGSFEHPKHLLELMAPVMGKKIFTILRSKTLFI